MPNFWHNPYNWSSICLTHTNKNLTIQAIPYYWAWILFTITTKIRQYWATSKQSV